MTAHKELLGDGVTISFPIIAEDGSEMLLTFGYRTRNGAYIMTDGDAVMHSARTNFMNYPEVMSDKTFENVLKPILVTYSEAKQRELDDAIENAKTS